MPVDMDNVSACWVDCELQCLIAEIGLSMPGDLCVVEVRSPHGDFDAIDESIFNALHVTDQNYGFFAVWFSIGFNPSYF